MNNFRQKYGILYRLTACAINFFFIFSMIMPVQMSYAQTALPLSASGINLPAPGAMITITPAFNPPIVKGISCVARGGANQNPALVDKMPKQVFC